MGFIEIKLTKYRLYLTESEITKLLSKDTDLWQEALKRGKAFKRAESAKNRCFSQEFGCWQLYEFLKNGTQIDNTIIRCIETMPHEEMKEAIIEFLLAQTRSRVQYSGP